MFVSAYTGVAMAATKDQMEDVDRKITEYFDAFGPWAEVSIEVKELRQRKSELESQFVRLHREFMEMKDGFSNNRGVGSNEQSMG